MNDVPVAGGPGSFARFLHWSMAAMIVGLYVLGAVVEEVPRGASRDFGMMLHQSFGLLFVVLLLARLAVRPAAAAATSAFERTAARLMHLALYALMVITPLAGLGKQWARGRVVDVFGLFALPSPLDADRALSKAFGEVHETAAVAILVLAGVHAAAALWHHFVRRDDVLRGILGRTNAAG
jgi:cytochrome b561